MDNTQPTTQDTTQAPDPQAAIAAAPASAPPPAVAQPDSTPTQAPQPTSRLGAILSAVAKTVSTGLAGVPDRGRPSFVGGLGEGARAQQQAQATQNAIKFKTFDDQVRMAQLHNQDLKMQQDTQEQQDAHTKAEIDNRNLANQYGLDYDTIANHGPAVMDHLTAQTAANGAASVPAGTHVSSDGSNIYMPKDPDSQQTKQGQKQLYSALSPALGLPALPQGADFVPPKLMNMLTNKVNGFGIDGNPIKHEDLPGVLGAAQAQRDNLAKNGGTPAQLKTLDNMIGIYNANLNALDKHSATVKQQALDVQNSPENIAAAAKKASAVAAAQQPFKEAQDRFQQTLKDGDPNSAGQMLADGDIAPSQIISTRNPAFAQQAFAAAKKSDPTYNPQEAEGFFKVASSPTNVAFFGSAKSLTDPKGTLDQLQDAYKQLPNGQIPKLNSVADWTSAAAGKGPVAGFAQTAIGVADDYAKVMGGGQGTDSARNEILKTFAMASSPAQMQAAIDAARAAVGSQMKSRIGDNKVLQRMYGSNIPTNNTTPTTQQFTHLSASGKYGYDGTKWVPTGK